MTDRETLAAALAAHKGEGKMLTRRMVINMADFFEEGPMKLVARMEAMGLIPAGSGAWFRSNGGITTKHCLAVRRERMRRAMGTA